MINKQQIINLALIRIGDTNPINADLTNNAYINDIYNTGKQILLSKHYWNFAQKIIQLSLINDTTELYPYKYKYELPIDMGALVCLNNKGIVYSDYIIIDKFIYINYNPVTLRYVSILTENDIYPPYFADVFSFYIAKELCNVRGSSNMLNVLEPLYMQSLKDAISQDGRDVPSPILINNYYTKARFYG